MHSSVSVVVFACVGLCVCICARVFMHMCAYEVGKKQEERSIQLDVLFPSMTQ